jgi:hypothetical protein
MDIYQKCLTIKYKIALITVLALLLYCKNTPNVNSPLSNTGIKVTAPSGGSTFFIGDSIKITWGLDTTVSGLVFEFTPNNGRSFFIIGEVLTTSSAYLNKEYSWTIPDSVTNNGSLIVSTISDSCKIWAHDYFNYSIGALSEKTFSIRKKP